MILNTALKSLEVLLTEVIVTNQLDITTSYGDITQAGLLPGASDGVTNGVTAVTAVAAPAAGVQRLAQEIRVYNADTVPHGVVLRLNNNGTFRVIETEEIAAGATFTYTPTTVSEPGGGTPALLLETGTLSQKISALSAAATMAGTELVAVVQGGVTVRTTAQDTLNIGIMNGTDAVSIISAASKNATFATAAVTGSDNSGEPAMFSGDVVDGNSGGVFVGSGSATGTGISGGALVGSGLTNSGKSGAASVFTGDAAAGETGDISIATGAAGAGLSGKINLVTGTSDGSTGPIAFRTGEAAPGGTSGTVDFGSGDAPGSGSGSGAVSLVSGAADGLSGTVALRSGNSAADSSGPVNVVTGDVASGTLTSGAIGFRTGSQADAGPSGPMEFATGDTAAGDTGDISFEPGAATGGTGGSIRLIPGTGTVADGIAECSTEFQADFFRVGAAGPTWTSGAGVPGATEPKGSIYSRTGGGVGTTLYVSQGGGTWNAVALV